MLQYTPEYSIHKIKENLYLIRKINDLDDSEVEEEGLILYRVLSWNQQKVTGTRSVLFQRIIEVQVNGRLGMCPTCIEGKLKLSDEDWNIVICNGYFDKDTLDRVPCMFKCTKDETPGINKL